MGAEHHLKERVPEAGVKLDDAKERLQAAAEEPVKREKAPASFHVFILEDDLSATWRQLTGEDEPVTAPNRKQAILGASAAMTPEEKQAATFWAVPADQFQPRKPKPRQMTVYDWE